MIEYVPVLMGFGIQRAPLSSIKSKANISFSAILSIDCDKYSARATMEKICGIRCCHYNMRVYNFRVIEHFSYPGRMNAHHTIACTIHSRATHTFALPAKVINKVEKNAEFWNKFNSHCGEYRVIMTPAKYYHFHSSVEVFFLHHVYTIHMRVLIRELLPVISLILFEMK